MRATTLQQLNDIVNTCSVKDTRRVLTSLLKQWVTLTESRWDDLRFPAQGLNPPGGVSDPSRDTEDGTLRFSASSTELIAGIAQMPHSWKTGTEVRPHIHWAGTDDSAGDVVWRFEYKVFGRDEVEPTSWTSTEVTVASTEAHTISSFPAVSLTDRAISTMILWRVSRIGGDAADTYGEPAKLYEFDLHYLRTDLGSEEEFAKYES